LNRKQVFPARLVGAPAFLMPFVKAIQSVDKPRVGLLGELM
jgi:hypothetical protein